MKQNVISILVDSVVWECVGTTRAKVSATPFLDSLKSESITATNLYSHGPYTDAATKSLYTGRNALDDYSFFYKLNSSPINHFRLFHENGYETFGIHYPYYMYGSEMRPYIDHYYYTSHFIFTSEWHTFMFFSKIIKQRTLYDYEIKLLKKRMELMFDVWINFYEDIIANPNKIQLLKKPFERCNVQAGLEVLKEQYQQFNNNQVKYINDFLEGNYHIFEKIDKIEYDSLMDRDYIDNQIFRKYESLFKQAARNNRKANRLSALPTLKRLLWGVRRFLKKRSIDEIKFIANYWFLLRPIEEMKRQSHLYEWQCNSSSQTQFELAADLLESRDANKPFYLSIHVEEPHNYLTCFTYDRQNPELHAKEMAVLQDYIDRLGTDFEGNILFFLSLRYVDYCIEKFCNYLKKQGLWGNTTLLIVADHGSSYTFSPLHGPRVNCFDDECYHIPMIIRSPGLQPLEFTGYCNSKDVLPTLMDVVGLAKSPFFKGHSMLDKNYRWPNYVMTEYAGPGCPEIRGRRLWFSVRNKEYMVAYRVAVYEKFEEGELVEVHNLIKDPNCYYNIADSIDRNQIDNLLALIQKRFDEVCQDSQKFIDSL